MCIVDSVLVGWNRPGGYAEYLTVPEQCLLEVPDDIEDGIAPLLLDTIGTAAHGIRFVQNLVPPDPLSMVLVTGAGPVGSCRPSQMHRAHLRRSVLLLL